MTVDNEGRLSIIDGLGGGPIDWDGENSGIEGVMVVKMLCASSMHLGGLKEEPVVGNDIGKVGHRLLFIAGDANDELEFLGTEGHLHFGSSCGKHGPETTLLAGGRLGSTTIGFQRELGLECWEGV